MGSKVRVWDLPTRVFHWSLVLCFTGLLVTGEVGGEAMVWHFRLGYSVLSLLLFRLVWGFVGPRHARFSDFVCRPSAVLAYVRDVLTLRARRTLGHNPAGGAMIVALLLSLSATIVSGLALYGADKGLGPLAGLLAESSDSLIDTLEESHEAATNFTLLLVAGHLLGVVWESLLHRENLVRAMFTGRKRA